MAAATTTDVQLLTTAVTELTRHALQLMQVVDASNEATGIAMHQVQALQTVVLNFVDLVEGLQRRVDQLERRTSPVRAVGRLQ